MNISRLVIATHNSGKLREFRSLLSNTDWEILGLRDLAIEQDYDETGTTYAENAALKARNYSLHTDLPVLGDDSGLEVVSLGRRPGVYSSRYAGPGAADIDRIRKLVQELQQAGGSRDARFVCALALAREGSVLLEAEGECRGVIINEPRGGRGFGYDPVFCIPELGKTYAELTEDEKNRLSHRAAALGKLLSRMCL